MTPGQRFALTTLPLLVSSVMLLVVAVVLVRRQAAAGKRDETPFASTPYVLEDPLPFLRGYTSMERLYLKEQLKTALAMCGGVGWIFAALLCAFALSTSSAYAVLWHDAASRLWYSLLSVSRMQAMFIMFPLILAITSIVPIRLGIIARFYLTRPIPIGVLFWSRVLPTIAALVAGMFTGVCLTLALVWVFKGPIWQHLPSAIPGASDADCGCAGMYRDMPATSAPRLFLSMLTTAALLYSGAIALLVAPLNRKAGSGVPVSFFLLFGGIFVVAVLRLFQIVSHWQFSLVPRQLFVYTDFGPPPPYAYALFPVALTIGLLLLSRSFVNRLEV